MMGSNRLNYGSRAGVSQKMHALERQWQGRMLVKPKQAGVYDLLANPESRLGVMHELWRLGREDQGFPEGGSKEFTAAAKIIREVQQELVD